MSKSKPENDFGIDFSENLDEIIVQAAENKVRSARAKDLDRVLKEVYYMVRPLLVSLAQNPEKLTIRWPNRAEQANAFLSQLDEKVGSVCNISAEESE